MSDPWRQNEILGYLSLVNVSFPRIIVWAKTKPQLPMVKVKINFSLEKLRKVESWHWHPLPHTHHGNWPLKVQHVLFQCPLTLEHPFIWLYSKMCQKQLPWLNASNGFKHPMRKWNKTKFSCQSCFSNWEFILHWEGKTMWNKVR